MRARNLKPGIFKNEVLATSDPLYTVIFAGLWCVADRAGRLEDRPRKIHMEINPGRAFESTERSLEWLDREGFILRYESDGQRFIAIPTFSKHQNPHVNERQSTIPEPKKNGASTGHEQEQYRSRTRAAREQNKSSTSGLGLIPSSLIPDSGFLTPDPQEDASSPTHTATPPRAGTAHRSRERVGVKSGPKAKSGRGA